MYSIKKSPALARVQSEGKIIKSQRFEIMNNEIFPKNIMPELDNKSYGIEIDRTDLIVRQHNLTQYRSELEEFTIENCFERTCKLCNLTHCYDGELSGCVACRVEYFDEAFNLDQGSFEAIY